MFLESDNEDSGTHIIPTDVNGSRTIGSRGNCECVKRVFHHDSNWQVSLPLKEMVLLTYPQIALKWSWLLRNDGRGIKTKH